MYMQPRRGPTQAPQAAPPLPERAIVAITVGSVIGFCLIACLVFVVLAALGIIHGRHSTAGSGPMGVSTAIAATNTPGPTATPANALDRGPHLGGVHAEFNKLLDGQNATMFPLETVVAGQHVTVGVWEASDTTDDQDRIREIDLATTTGWANAQAAMPVIQFFLPPDAHAVRTETKDVSQFGTVVHHIYKSRLLAQFIGPSVFYDDLDLVTPIPPGTFEWYCWSNHGYVDGPYGECDILTRAPAA